MVGEAAAERAAAAEAAAAEAAAADEPPAFEARRSTQRAVRQAARSAAAQSLGSSIGVDTRWGHGLLHGVAVPRCVPCRVHAELTGDLNRMSGAFARKRFSESPVRDCPDSSAVLRDHFVGARRVLEPVTNLGSVAVCRTKTRRHQRHRVACVERKYQWDEQESRRSLQPRCCPAGSPSQGSAW